MSKSLKDQFREAGTLDEIVSYISLYGVNSASVHYNKDLIAMLKFCQDEEINHGDKGFGSLCQIKAPVGEDLFDRMAAALENRISQAAVKLHEKEEEIKRLGAENAMLREELSRRCDYQEGHALPAINRLLEFCENTTTI